MKTFTGAALAAALLVVFAAAAGSSGATQVTALEKVLEMLQGMLKKAEEGKKAEAVQWTAYTQWCSDTEKSKQDQVKAADIKIEALEADIQAFDAEIVRLEDEIEDHEADIVGWNASLHNATAERGRENAEYLALHQDYSESVKAVGLAIEAVKKQAYDRPQATLLLQRLATEHVVPAAARHAMDAFLSLDNPDELALVGEPGEAHGYEFQSGGILDLLKELQEKFTSERNDLEKQEMTKLHDYEMLAHDYAASTAAAKNEIKKKTESKTKAKQAMVEAQTQLDDMSGTRGDDMKFLDELHATCNQKADDFGSREELRQGEIDALSKAIAIISSETVSGAAKKHLPALVVSKAKVNKKQVKALVHLRAAHNSTNQEKAAAFLQGASAKVGSHVLLALALRVRDDPFGKVKKMIQDLISRLEEEAQAEADHKQWCDDELSTNEGTRTTKTAEVEGLHHTIDELEAKLGQIAREIATLSKAIADLAESMAKETKMRDEEKARNEDTIAEAAAAQMSVQNAITTLQDYYATASESTALVQGSAHSVKAPPIFDKAFKGQQSQGSNVVSFLQVIQSDFARLESETSGAEQAAQEEHDAFMSEANQDKMMKEKELGDATSDQKIKGQDLSTARSDLELAQSELDAALEYYDKLKPSCVGADASAGFEERTVRREEEVQALKEALQILNGETISTAPQSLYSSVDGGNVGLDIGVTAN